MTTRDEFIEARLREELDFGKITIEVAGAIRWIAAFSATMADQAARHEADELIGVIYNAQASTASAIMRRLAAIWEDHPDHPTEEDPR